MCIIEQLLLNERPLSGAGLVAGIASGSSCVFILLACSFSILIYKWYKRRHSRVIPITQRTIRKLSADLERNEGKGPNPNYPDPNFTADAKDFCLCGKPLNELKKSLVDLFLFNSLSALFTLSIIIMMISRAKPR